MLWEVRKERKRHFRDWQSAGTKSSHAHAHVLHCLFTLWPFLAAIFVYAKEIHLSHTLLRTHVHWWCINTVHINLHISLPTVSPVTESSLSHKKQKRWVCFRRLTFRIRECLLLMARRYLLRDQLATTIHITYIFQNAPLTFRIQ
jgi:hypothetical protein